MSLAAEWRERWQEALRTWGRFVTVHAPTLHGSTADAGRLDGAFAAFLLDSREVVIDLAAVAERGLSDLPVEVLAHEIGHHVLCPGDLADHGRLLVRVRHGLPGLEKHAPMIANLYADMLINDRLQRSRGLRMDLVYARLAEAGADSRLWTLYLRIYEVLWALPSGTLVAAPVDPELDGDAQLGAKLVRVYATDWLAGAGGFAALCWRHLREDVDNATAQAMTCVGMVGPDAQIPGLTGRDDDGPAVHPALDPRVNEYATTSAEPADPTEEVAGPPGRGQYREPFEYGQLLGQLGLTVAPEDVAARYYRERAMPHLVPFPVRRTEKSTEPLPEGLGAWDVGEPLEAVDWLASTLRSPVVVPGVTTVQRLHGAAAGAEQDVRPVDLDIYVDSSGSMPNPASFVSYLTLAGAVLALSALRVGARVQATLWSGARQFTRTDGFVRDERAVLAILTGHFGGATAFPLHVLRETYLARDRPTHVVVISDDGVDTMFLPNDEWGRPGSEIAAAALAAAGAGGTLLLRLHSEAARQHVVDLAPGWDVRRVTNWDELVEFAAAFSRRTYERSER
jgi:hypothetical protein